VPLTAAPLEQDELLGGGRTTRAPARDETTNRVLTKGEPIAAPSGRADDFSWPRSGAVNAEPVVTEPLGAPSVTRAIVGTRTKPGKPASGESSATDGTSQPEPTEQKPEGRRRSKKP
jgi:uncharacterized protein